MFFHVVVEKEKSRNKLRLFIVLMGLICG